ncbi:unnamed protein product, partial [Polarella glacialis]
VTALQAVRLNGLEISAITCNAMLSACRGGKQWTKALDQLRMRLSVEDLPAPDVISYSAAAAACGSSGRWDQATALLFAMTQQAVLPNVITFSTVVTACGKGLQWQVALEILWYAWRYAKGAEDQPNVVTVSAAVSACEKCLQWQASVALLGEARLRAVEPNLVTRNAALSACSAAARWAMSLDLLFAAAKQREGQ